MTKKETKVNALQKLSASFCRLPPVVHGVDVRAPMHEQLRCVGVAPPRSYVKC